MAASMDQSSEESPWSYLVNLSISVKSSTRVACAVVIREVCRSCCG
jgi:hypothetical protein